jgi:uncharacterized damage-inducible protein DinB
MAAGERAMLEAFLDRHRRTLLVKCAGLTGEQLATRATPPSTLSLLGLVRHLADVERNWFQRVLDGRAVPGIFWTDAAPDGDFDDVDPARAAEDLATFHAEIAAGREIAARHELDDVGRLRRTGGEVSLRWIYMHLIEEYARHNGHADLLREAIDGVTGE